MEGGCAGGGFEGLGEMCGAHGGEIGHGGEGQVVGQVVVDIVKDAAEAAVFDIWLTRALGCCDLDQLGGDGPMHGFAIKRAAG